MESIRDLREFPELQNVDQQYPDSIIHQMHFMLDSFASGELPNAEYTFDHLFSFVKSLVERQNGPDSYITWGGNWSLIPTNELAPADARVELIFFPSYLAVSFLSLFWYRYPEPCESIHNYFVALHNGLHFITARNLFGHGMEGDEQREEAVHILIKGGVHHYLRKRGVGNEQCDALRDALLQFKRERGRHGHPSFSCVEIIEQLVLLPSDHLDKTSFFSWQQDNGGTHVTLECPYTTSPGSELATEETVLCYNKILKEIFRSRQPAVDKNGNERKGLHVIVRGMANKYGRDVEISSRSGQTCDNDVLVNITNALRWNLARHSMREYIVTIDTLFGGGSKYLDYLRGGIPGGPDLEGLGHSHDVLEVRFSQTMRSVALGRIKDALVCLVDSHQESLFA